MDSNRWRSFLCLLLLHIWMLRARADKYCAASRDTVRNVGMTGIMEERIIPRTDGVGVPPGGLSCEFKISFDQPDSPAVAVLSGFDVNKHLNRRRAIRSADSPAPAAAMKYELSVPDSNATCSPPPTMSPRPVTLDMLRVLQLPRGSSMTVTYQLNSNNQNTPGMRIQVMEAGFCSRDITNFDHSCFMTSSTRRSLEAELTALSEDGSVMRLAAFSNSSVLHSFVRESQRVRVGSGLKTHSKIPLSLTERHRIGMFYERSTGSVFYLSSAGPECQVKLFEDPRELNCTFGIHHQENSTVFCGSLRVVTPSSGGDVIVVVEFGDCGEPLPALLSFADEAGVRCGNCSRAALNWLVTHPTVTEPPSAEPPTGKTFTIAFSTAGGVSVALVVSAVLLIKFRHRILRRTEKKSRRNASGSPDQATPLEDGNSTEAQSLTVSAAAEQSIPCLSRHPSDSSESGCVIVEVAESSFSKSSSGTSGQAG